MFTTILSLFATHLVGFWGGVAICMSKPRMKASLSIREMLPLVAFNQLIITPAMIYAFLNNEKIITMESSLYDVCRGITLLPLMLLILNGLFATSHYIFHKNKWLYKHIHSIHHRLWVPHPIGSIYAHPIEHILANLLPVGVAILITGAQWWTTHIFILLVSYETVEGHTHFISTTSNHILHHAKLIYNYDNNPYLFDRLIGTYRKT